LLSFAFEASAFAEVTIGDFIMVRNREITDNSLRVLPAGRAGHLSFAFLGKVGGVSFEAIAELPADRSGDDVCPHYTPTAPDGSRLGISVGGEPLSTSIYDWQLLPIASYADSEYTSVVSLFGPQTNQSQFHITYHPAFEDTLIGLRLLQADALLIDPTQFSKLPKYNGAVIMGAGESDFPFPDFDVDKISGLLDRLRESDGFQSWVISDINKSAKIVINNGTLTVNLEPYHYFWRADYSGTSHLQNELITLELETLGTSLDKLDRIKEIAKRMDEIEAQIQATEPGVVEASSATSELEANREIVNRLNPPVAEALRTTARFAALFRLAKKVNAECWSAFLESLSGLNPEPSIETPNIWPKAQ